LRKSITRRIVKLLIYMFVRSNRDSAPETPAPAFRTKQLSQARA
jgi:hypothetical protein